MKTLHSNITPNLTIVCLDFSNFLKHYNRLYSKEIIDATYGPLTYLFTGDILHACYLQHPQSKFKFFKAIHYEDDLPQFKEIITIGTPFQHRIWELLLNIPRGQTKTYGQIAQECGNPNAARAVGQAVGANPVGVHIPCHRVVGSNGQLGGFYWGVDIKKEWIEKEKK